MMRDLKGVDLFLDALPLVAKSTGKTVTATLVGNGPDLVKYKQLAEKFDETVGVTFLNSRPSKEVFPLGKTMVVPSRAESMPHCAGGPCRSNTIDRDKCLAAYLKYLLTNLIFSLKQEV